MTTTGDGLVSRHEYTNYVTVTTPELHDFAHALYDDYDVTGDHHLNHVDYDQYYAKLDANGEYFINYHTAFHRQRISFYREMYTDWCQVMAWYSWNILS